MVFKDPTYKVKNTFVELPPAEEEPDPSSERRARSECPSHESTLRNTSSPLVVASRSPHVSPMLRPMDENKALEAVPIDECDFEMLEEAAQPFDADAESRPPFRPRGDSDVHVAMVPGHVGREEPAYVVPATPSPYMHPSFPPSTVPPFANMGGLGALGEMGLPPAFPGDDAERTQDPEVLMNMHPMAFNIPPEMMFDPNFMAAYGAAWAGMPGMDSNVGLGAFPGVENMPVTSDLLPLAEEEAPAILPEEPPQASLEPDVSNGHPSPEVPATVLASGGHSGAGWSQEPAAAAEAKAKDGRKKKNKSANASPPASEAEANGGGRRDDSATSAPPAGAGDRGGSSSKADRDPPAQAKANEKVQTSQDKSKVGTKDAAAEDPEIPADFTTVMLRNIPNKYTREMLIKQLKMGFDGQFDFMYLPIDFKNKCNVGYAFINFRTPESCATFVDQFHGVDVRKCLPGLNSKKIVEVTPARVQGMQENVRRLRNSPVMNQLQDHPEWMPLLFNADGLAEPFPMPDQPLPPVKPRGRNREPKNTDS